MNKKLSRDKCQKVNIVILFIILIFTIFQFINIYKKYNTKKEENIYLSFYNGNIKLNEMPKKGNAENLGFDHAECDNGASVEWNRKNWIPIITNITKSKTKCKLYFAPNLINNYIEQLAETDTINLVYDRTEENNLRYIEKYPNNYIDIGDRDSSNKPILWRIIGVMNNMTVINDDKSESTGESLVKIIRANNIGWLSWDSSASGVNSGRGVNEWSQADLMTTLNKGAYWNKESGQCYSSSSDKQTTCDFSSTGLTESVKNDLAKVRWNTGTLGEAYSSTVYNNDIKFNVKMLYTAEQSSHNGKEQCASSGGSYCNDPVERKTTWDGYIGLMYPSDYGYAVGGDKRDDCLAITIYKWNNSSYNCTENNWLYGSSTWSIIPSTELSYASKVFYLVPIIDDDFASNTKSVLPTAYLKRNIKIKPNSASDYGSQNNPFVIEGVN